MRNVSVEHRDAVAVVRLDLPPVNALTSGALEQLSTVLDRQRAAGGVVLTGHGQVFCGGFDLDALSVPDPLLSAFDRALTTIATHPRPVVAAVNGAAIAAGCILALAADVTVFDPTAAIALPEVVLGLPFSAMSLKVLHAALGPVLPRLLYAQRPMPAQHVMQIGASLELASTADVLESAVATAARLAEAPAAAFELIKAQMRGPVLRGTAYDALASQVREHWRSADLERIQRIIMRRDSKETP